MEIHIDRTSRIWLPLSAILFLPVIYITLVVSSVNAIHFGIPFSEYKIPDDPHFCKKKVEIHDVPQIDLKTKTIDSMERPSLTLFREKYFVPRVPLKMTGKHFLLTSIFIVCE